MYHRYDHLFSHGEDDHLAAHMSLDSWQAERSANLKNLAFVKGVRSSLLRLGDCWVPFPSTTSFPSPFLASLAIVPHIQDHLKSTEAFKVESLHWLVLDEADRYVYPSRIYFAYTFLATIDSTRTVFST